MMVSVPLAEEAPGAFAAELTAGQAGVWQGTVRASGKTHHSSLFRREQSVSAAVMIGGDKPPQLAPTEDSPLACLLGCLAHDRSWRRWLEEKGIDASRLENCIAACRTATDEELSRLG